MISYGRQWLLSRKQYLRNYFGEGAKFYGHLRPGLAIGIFTVGLAGDIWGSHGLVDTEGLLEAKEELGKLINKADRSLEVALHREGI